MSTYFDELNYIAWCKRNPDVNTETNCADCQGAGVITCPYCDGAGITGRYECAECYGRGGWTCKACSGTGKNARRLFNRQIELDTENLRRLTTSPENN